MGTTIVGVDGSSNSQNALRWALDHTSPADTVTALGTWSLVGVGQAEAMYAMAPQLEESIRAAVMAAVRLACSETGRQVDIEIRNGHAGRSLIDASDGADMLVVGSRGHGGFAGLLLGSVSTYCVHHTKCPLVIVPAET